MSRSEGSVPTLLLIPGHPGGRNKLSVNVVATSEVSVSLTLNKNIEMLFGAQKGPENQNWAKNVQDTGLRGVLEDMQEVADVEVTGGRSIITLIANVKKSSSVMATVFRVLSALGVQVEMLSQGASKVNISIVIPGDKEKEVVKALHSCFFEDECLVDMGSPLVDEACAAEYPQLVVTA